MFLSQATSGFILVEGVALGPKFAKSTELMGTYCVPEVWPLHYVVALSEHVVCTCLGEAVMDLFFTTVMYM